MKITGGPGTQKENLQWGSSEMQRLKKINLARRDVRDLMLVVNCT